ncbi:related to Serine/threonine protein kinase [Ustilago sp. UG-2017a]|nr:related to Serine/threonine protein kinase [Ustilago sp. UG-2017a]
MSSHSRHPSPPASPSSGSGLGRNPAPNGSKACEANSMRSPGYPSPPASPPHLIQDQAATHSFRNVSGSSSALPASVTRSASNSSRHAYAPQSASAYTSMTSAGAAMQHASSAMQPPPLASDASASASTSTPYAPQHPPSKLATGGQSHSHRPVSAMPTPTEHHSSSATRNAAEAGAGGASNVFASMNANYTERRASAHPTMTSSHNPSSPATPATIDPTTSQAISSGIPITSPAALSYFAAHPRRQQVHFGNYLLLQTLGEGEFGKVKLGVHKEWGEEVAVKLIKRDKVATDAAPLNLDDTRNKDPAKMSKVEREIQVLKDVRHPNIVRLYEVIESDRYIGIVLEYASGGELFDHILAHKYLKEEHACRLFAQLISGVSYLHQKKIVHRDLKLENLLLDRNRNVIITDFGFANNFEDRRDDLMATSCGSPCYAAPELVVQDGLYAGSAVDVWSCGVILYAMLAGYLPFDDDPANPDGDNINLLYKYILATPLSFPEYITAQPRDLLSKMLVPDPTRRACLEQVMQHSWLRNYRELFKFSVEDLERAAMEQQTKKRQMYRQQMVYQQQLQEQQRRQHTERSQSVRQNLSHLPVGTAYTSNTAVPAASAAAHRQTLPVSATVPDRLYEPVGSASRGAEPGVTASRISVPTVLAPAPVQPATPASVPRATTHSNIVAAGVASHTDPVTALGNARGEPRTRLDDHVPQPANAAEQRRPAAQKGQRHTIQLEYGGDERARKESASTVVASPPRSHQTWQSQRKVSQGSTTSISRASENERAKTASEKLAAAAVPPSVLQPATAKAIDAVPAVVPESGKVNENKAEAQFGAAAAPDMMRSVSATSASRVSVPSPVMKQNQTNGSAFNRIPSASSSSYARNRVPSSASASSCTRMENGSSSADKPAHIPTSATNSQRIVSNPLPAGEAVGFPSATSTTANNNDRTVSSQGVTTRTSASRQGSIAADAPAASNASPPPSAARPITGDQAAASASRHRKGMSTDKFFLSRLLGSNGTSQANGTGAAGVERPASNGAEANAEKSSKRNSVTRPAIDRAPSSGSVSKNSRRKAMSLVVGRQNETSPAAADRRRALEGGVPLPQSATEASFPTSLTCSSRRKEAPCTASQHRTAAASKSRNNSSSLAGPGSNVSTSRPVSSGTRQQQQQQDKTFYDGSTIASTSTAGPSSNAAKKVMDWFRKKSLSRGGTFNEQPPLGPFERSPTSSQISAHSPTAPLTPSVIVTGAAAANGASRHAEANTGSGEGISGASSVPSSRSASGTHSENSEATELTNITKVSDASHTSHTESEDLKSSASTVQQQATPKASLSAVSNVSNVSGGESSSQQRSRDSPAVASTKTAAVLFNEARLRYHLGAVDQSALTSRSPIEVLKEVHRVLYEMGINILKEKDEDFKLECIRRKRAKTLMSATHTIGMSIRSSVFPPTQADVERCSRMSHRDSLTPSASTPGGGSLRSLLRRGSYQPGVGLPTSSTVASNMVSLQQDENQPPPLYGDASVDGGQEIRFSVEVTRIKNLAGLYSLDIRRMKGNLWAYKFVYQALLDRCQLAA